MTPEIKRRIEQIRRGEVPEGYKKTKAGIMPIDWCVEKEHKAKDIFKSVTNKKHNGEFEVLSATQDKGVVPRSSVDIDIKFNEDNVSGYKKVDRGDFVISLRSFQGGIEYSEYEGLVSPAYTVLKPIVPICDGYYKAYFKTVDYISRLNKGTYGIRDGKQVGFDDFGDMIIHYPSLIEQEIIAEVLSTQDKVIKLQTSKIEQLKKLKKGYLLKMFPKKGCNYPELRFKGFTEAWKRRKLSEVCRNFEYGLNAAAKEYDGSNKYIRITDIDDYSRAFLTADLTSPDICLDGMTRYLLSNGDILFARTGASVGKTYIYKEKDGIVYFAGFLIRAKVTQDNDAEFVFQNTLTPNYEKYIRITSQRSGQPGVNAQEYGQYEFYLPSKVEQAKIGKYLRELDDLITLHQHKLDEEIQKKKALMQLLLTGIVRV